MRELTIFQRRLGEVGDKVVCGVYKLLFRGKPIMLEGIFGRKGIRENMLFVYI